mgnify:CR=1 FL=1
MRDPIARIFHPARRIGTDGMAARLNHTIVWCKDRHRSSAFMAEMLGLPDPVPFSHFMVVSLENDVSMDFMEKEGEVARQQHDDNH